MSDKPKWLEDHEANVAELERMLSVIDKELRIDTWGDFKKAVEAKGVKDDDQILFVDWQDGDLTTRFIDCKDGKRQVEIY